MKVVEIFGPTIQGEGPLMGRPAIFVRLAGCNNHCAFCDSPYSWDAKNAATLSIPQILKRIKLLSSVVRLVVITGGEPLLQAKDVAKLCEVLNSHGYHIQIETSGQVWPNADILRTFFFNQTTVVISPKYLKGKWQVDKKVYDYGIGHRKFVIGCAQDFDKAEEFIKKSVMQSKERIFFMPEGKHEKQQSNQNAWTVWDYCAKHGYRFSSRLHTVLFGNQRGV